MIFQLLYWIKNIWNNLLNNLNINYSKSLYLNKNNFEYILEFPIDFSFEDKLKDFPESEDLYLVINKFMAENEYFKNGIIISLSGGVDSMVLLRVLLKIRDYNFFKIYAVMINYNLRSESIDEIKFVQKFCNMNKVNITITHIENIKSCRKDIGSSKRKIFEDISKDIRFNSYQKLIKEFKLPGVLVGHHKDDVTENIFTNMLKGHNILDIEVMKPLNVIKSVPIFRPLLNIYKLDIYDFAHKYNVPYFKDTTPTWSRRGQMRNLVFPLLSNVFGDSWKFKLKEIGNQSNLLYDTVNEHLINPWINQANFKGTSSNKKFIFEFPIKYKNDLCLWYYTIPKLFFMVGHNSIKRKSIEKLFTIANNETDDTTKIHTLDKGYTASKINGKIFVFKEISSSEDTLLYDT